MRPSDGFVSWVLSAITPDGSAVTTLTDRSSGPQDRTDRGGPGDQRARRNLLVAATKPVLD